MRLSAFVFEQYVCAVDLFFPEAILARCSWVNTGIYNDTYHGSVPFKSTRHNK